MLMEVRLEMREMGEGKRRGNGERRKVGERRKGRETCAVEMDEISTSVRERMRSSLR